MPRARAQAMVWNDGALGCGQPGQMYLQVVTPGYWIILRHGQNSYDYRATQTGYVTPCNRPVVLDRLPGHRPRSDTE